MSWCFMYFFSSVSRLQLLGVGRGRSNAGHGVRTSDSTHRGAGHDASQRHPTDDDVQCYLSQRDPGKTHIVLSGACCNYKSDKSLKSKSVSSDPGPGLPGGVHLPGRRSSGLHFREHYSESGLGRRERQEIFPVGPAQCHRWDHHNLTCPIDFEVLCVH